MTAFTTQGGASSEFDVIISRTRTRPAAPCRSVVAGESLVSTCPTVTVTGPLAGSTVHTFCEHIMDVVFSLPACDLILDLEGVTEVDEAGLEAIRRVRMTLEDQDVQLHIVGPANQVSSSSTEPGLLPPPAGQGQPIVELR